MSRYPLMQSLRRWFRRLGLGGIALVLTVATLGCGQTVALEPGNSDMSPLAPATQTRQPLAEPLEITTPSPGELDKGGATSPDPIADDTAEMMEATKAQLEQSLEATAEDASKSLQELNQEAAKVLDDEMSRAADAINAEIEQASKLKSQPADD